MEKTKVWFLRNCWLLFSCSVMPNSLQSHGLYSPFNSPGQNTGVGRLSLLQGISPTQGLNPGLPQCKQILYQLSHKGSPGILEWAAYPFFSRSSWPRNWTGVPDAKSWLIGKDPDDGKDWGQEEKGMTEDEVVGWHHWLDGHGIGWTLGVGDRQGGLACCGLWGHRFGHDWAIELNSCIAGRFFTNWPMREACLSEYISRLISIDSMMPSNHLILSPPSAVFSLAQHQGLFQWVGFSHQVAKVLELQHKSFQWMFRVDFL